MSRRDLAVLTLLWRLGLRSFEVAGLSLDDVDWRAGAFAIRDEGTALERLPLTDDVGRAVVDYLHAGRPMGSDREVFLHVRAPHRLGGFRPRMTEE